MRWLHGFLVIVAASFGVACSDDGVPENGTTVDTTTGDSGTTTMTGPPTTTASTDTGSSGPSETSGIDPTGTSSADSSGSSSSGSGTSGSGTDSSGSSDSGTSGGPLGVGEACQDDSECMTLVCWDFADYDPLCFGTACSGPCTNDDDCIELLTDAGAPNPESTSCGPDGRCDMVGTGFGSFACAAPRTAELRSR